MKRGFTLMELLAVLIILSAIMLIAIPIVNNIITSSKNSLSDAQIKNIEKAAEQYYLNEGINDNENCVSVSYLLENGYIDSEKILNPKDGEEINGSVKIEYRNSKFLYTYSENRCAICDAIYGDGTLVGDKLVCEVKPGTKYNFYVLSHEEDGTTNLIMDQNINSDGTPAGMTGIEKNGDNVYNLVAWNLSGSNTGGPVDVMQFLYNATKDWININSITYEYKDKEYQETPEPDTSYTAFVSNGGIAIITALDETTTTTIGTSDEPLRARMPIYSYGGAYGEKLIEKGEVAEKTAENAYLYDNLDSTGSSGLYGYWTLSSDYIYFDSAWSVEFGGHVNAVSVSAASYSGVRPVINVSKEDIQVINSSLKICEGVNEDTVTTGNIPSGDFNNGDEYICEVKSGVKYHFFVLSKEGKKINLIMDRNICDDGTVASSSNKCTVAYNLSGNAVVVGPVTAMEYLNEATNTWANIPNMNIVYDDEGGNFTKFNIAGKVRLPYLSEVSNYDSENKTNTYIYDYLMNNGIQKNIINGISGYWTISTTGNSTSNSKLVFFAGSIIDMSSTTASAFGVRPVISLPKNRIK